MTAHYAQVLQCIPQLTDTKDERTLRKNEEPRHLFANWKWGQSHLKRWQMKMNGKPLALGSYWQAQGSGCALHFNRVWVVNQTYICQTNYLVLTFKVFSSCKSEKYCLKTPPIKYKFHLCVTSSLLCFDQPHKGGIFTLSLLFSNSIFWFYKRKDFKDED